MLFYSKNDGYNPNPKDLRGVNVTREMLDMAEKLAENAHNIWALVKKTAMESIGCFIFSFLINISIGMVRWRSSSDVGSI